MLAQNRTILLLTSFKSDNILDKNGIGDETMPPYYTSERVTDEYLTVNNSGERVLDIQSERTLRENGRLDFGLQYIAKGRAYYVEDGKTYTVEAGTALLHFPRVPQHYFFKKQDAAHLQWVHFTGQGAATLLARLQSEKTVAIRIHETAKFSRTLSRLIECYTMKCPFFETACVGHLTVLLSMLLASALADTADTRPHDGLAAVYRHMQLHFAEPIDLDKYAQMCYISRDRFMHLFKQHSGVSPYHFQLQLRIDRAAEMLAYTGISITDCALAVGFKDAAYFCRLFKKYTGMTPTAYRKR